MTDRIAGYVVTFDKDMRDDDVESTTNAIRMVKGVIGVQPLISSPELLIAYQRAKNKIWSKILDLYKEEGC